MSIFDIAKTYRLPSPLALNLWLRQNLAESNPESLFFSPLMIPVYIANPSGSSPIINWYDRNAVSLAFNYDHQDNPPFINNNVWSYTCPPKRKAFVEMIMVSIRRTFVSALAGMDAAGVYFQSSGGAPILLMYRSFYDNTVGAGSEETVAQNLLMQPGDMLQGLVFEGSTGGSIFNHVAAKITEFDA